MAYAILLVIHSWLRWGVIIAALWSLFRSISGWRKGSAWVKQDRILQLVTVSLVDVQILLGFGLYFGLSPLTPMHNGGFGAVMHDNVLRFFSIEHPFAMILALIAVHVASVMSKRAATDPLKHKKWAVGLLIASVLVLLSIPWPGLPYARPLSRF